jgi:hypothetical protein
MNAFHCKPGGTWEFAWVRYLESRETNPVVSAHSPVFGKYEGEPLRHGIAGLRAEALAEAAPATMGLWSELIHGYVMRFAQPHRRDSRLWKLWKAVDEAPARAWSLHELADAFAPILEIAAPARRVSLLCRLGAADLERGDPAAADPPAPRRPRGLPHGACSARGLGWCCGRHCGPRAAPGGGGGRHGAPGLSGGGAGLDGDGAGLLKK